ncbi:MAG: TRAP transporter large permease [Synergistales bacterium]|nr:TRAP transporter large permease [Synergistales bacterium]
MMEPVTVGLGGIAVMLALLVTGIPIAINFFLVGFSGLALLIGFQAASGFLGEALYYTIASPTFCALPLFILMGAFAAQGGFAEKAYEGIHDLAARLPGSLAIATTFGCAAFGAVSGSSLATAALFGKIVLPEMLRYRYNKSFALGSIAAAGGFAAMIPPSAGFIVYAIITGQSVGKLFIAGILPGVLTAVTFSAVIILRVLRRPELAPQLPPETGEKRQAPTRAASLGKMWSIGLIAAIVLGGIYTGLFTPTEAAAIGAALALILGAAQGKIRRFAQFREAMRDSARTTSMVFLIMVGALFFGRFLALTRVPTTFSEMVSAASLPPFLILAGILLIWFLLGMIVIPTGIMALTLPIFFPVITSLGYDPIWFGVIIIKLGEIAAITPPVGLNVYTLKGVAGEGTTLEEVFSGAWPFVLCELFVLLLLVLFPRISLFLPGLM